LGSCDSFQISSATEPGANDTSARILSIQSRKCGGSPNFSGDNLMEGRDGEGNCERIVDVKLLRVRLESSEESVRKCVRVVDVGR